MAADAQGPHIQLAMTAGERRLLESFLCCTDAYAEFGAGGSTALAATLVSGAIVSVDSSEEWLNIVRTSCESLPIQPTLVLADIGPVGDWGRPLDDGTKERWPAYHEDLWSYCDPAKIDFCLVDGRFRVACALTALMKCRPSSFVAIHDYQSRSKYHVIEKFAVQVARCEELSIFTRRWSVADCQLAEAITTYRYEPD